ncbi:LacI family DNA-binding transcriptional regulator [Caproiciproducens galactitolivorans]|uniref:LacI family DNA-binding transcriptional regulator n=1 Tax=Caproiciproducens galactitolivorans TaxID=642589 RepID=UPI002409F0EC|nr:LacI family DNA-binding transcriptional regulator [Caproiciproducens galactitolivorans]
MVSIKEVAERCGVSVATVSKALNGHRDIGESTRERVRKAAAEMGYTPNSAARSLKTNRSYNIGVLFVDETQRGLTHEYFSTVLESFKVESEKRGYDITFINRNIGGKATSYLEHCLYRRMDGVVVASVDFNDPQVIELVNSKLPIVTIDHIFNNRTAIISDNIRGVRDLVTYLYKKGHRRIAFIHGENTAVTENRLTSFYKTCSELGIEVPDSYVKEARYHDAAATARCTAELLALPRRPTCIMFPDDFSYIGGMNVILEAGLSIPDDISVVGYDGIWLSQILSPRLTTLKQDTSALGRAAAEQLVNQIERPRTTLPERIIIPGKLLEGRSVRQL